MHQIIFVQLYIAEGLIMYFFNPLAVQAGAGSDQYSHAHTGSSEWRLITLYSKNCSSQLKSNIANGNGKPLFYKIWLYVML